MALFRKKKDDDYEEDDYEDEDEEEERRKPLKRKVPRSRDFKDLNPEDKKNRKEPPKPWGKKERIIVLFLILLTAGISGFLAVSSRDWKLPGLPRLKFPAISAPNFFGEETIVIQGNKKDKAKSEKAINAFLEKTDPLNGVYGLYVIRLADGFSYGINEDEVFQAASLIKLPVMAGMYQEEEAGRINLDSKYRLKNSDKVAGAGSLYSKPSGYEITYRNLIKLMGKESDNTAFNITKNLLGEKKIDEIAKKIGMVNTNIENNETDPKDIGIFFKELWNGKLINEKNKNELLGFMTDTSYENWLAAGVPEGVRVAHKYGREVHVVNDGGIIFSKEPFVVVILSKGVVDKEADDIFPELTRAVYDSETEN